jgi:hypothetical protein
MNHEKYDLVVAYRIYPRVSLSPLVFQKDKYNLSKLCLESFKLSLGNLKVKIFVLLDNCPPEYKEIFKKYFLDKDLEFIDLEGIGNFRTFNMQIDILLKQNYSDIIYFAEDDYFYLPNQFYQMVDFLVKNKDVHFVSPYDHLDYYTHKIYNSKYYVKIFNDRHWRTASFTCLTFLTTKSTLLKTRYFFRSYSRRNYDISLWLGLTKYGVFSFNRIFQNPNYADNLTLKIYVKIWLYGWYRILFGKRWKLWIPIPSIGTHMQNDRLAPTIAWIEKINKQLSDINKCQNY